MASVLIIHCVFVAILSQASSCTLTDFQLNREVDILAGTTTNIIKQFYSKRASALSIIRFSMQARTHFKQSEIINRVLFLSTKSVAYVIEEPTYMKRSPFLRTNGIVFVDGYEAFR